VLFRSDTGFDPTEAAVPWKTLVLRGHEVVIATETGISPTADKNVLEGFLGGHVMRTLPQPQEFYSQMLASQAVRNPIKWSDVKLEDFDGLLLVGGHAEGMRQYLDSEVVREITTEFWRAKKPVGAICHGVLVLARANLLRSVVSTSVPKFLESQAYMLTRYLSGMGKYQLSTTWPLYVQDEVEPACPGFTSGPVDALAAFRPGSATSHAHAFVTHDNHYVSGRFWGDAYLFAQVFTQAAEEHHSPS